MRRAGRSVHANRRPTISTNSSAACRAPCRRSSRNWADCAPGAPQPVCSTIFRPKSTALICRSTSLRRSACRNRGCSRSRCGTRQRCMRSKRRLSPPISASPRNTEGQLIRLRVPELNQERRKELVKVAHKYAETARVAVRHVRRDGMEVLKKLEKDGKMSRDEHDRHDARKCRRRLIEAIARHRSGARHQGKRDHDRLTRRLEIPDVSRSRRCELLTAKTLAPPVTSPSSWTAMAGGRRSAVCRAARAIAAASRRCAAPSAPPAILASAS